MWGASRAQLRFKSVAARTRAGGARYEDKPSIKVNKTNYVQGGPTEPPDSNLATPSAARENLHVRIRARKFKRVEAVARRRKDAAPAPKTALETSAKKEE
jgi:hypothetical protein